MPASHVIQRQHLLLRLAPGGDGRAVQKRAEAALQSRPLLEALDAALSASTGRADDWLTLDRLELDLGQLDSAQLERQLLDRLPDLLRRQVAEARTAAGSGAVFSAAAVLQTAAGTAWEAWGYFLRHGTLPAHWPPPATIAAWETELLALLADLSGGRQAGLRTLLASEAVRQRLVRQFSAELCAAVLGALDATVRPHQVLLAEALAPLLRRLESYSGAPGEQLAGELLRRAWMGAPIGWPDLLAVLAPEKRLARPEVLARLALAALAVANPLYPFDAPPAETAAPAANEPQAADAEFIANAGVVLLHAFLPTCFAACGWLEGPEFSSETARAKAVLLVHFLATGAIQAPEYELRLPKLLCGVPVGTVLNRRLRLGQAARTEGLALLTAAINHWTALKNTSPDGLREAFLQREGKMELAPDGHHHLLTVEQRAQDVLLDRLPYGWGLGTVQLPWMPEHLRVSWA